MNPLAAIRRRQDSWTRRVLGIFAFVWLSLALQPCAMAMADEHDCPRCPPAHQQSHEHDPAEPHHMGHAASGGLAASNGLAANEHPCTGVVPCADAPGACSALESLYHDGRSIQPKVQDSTYDLPVAMLPADTIGDDSRPATPSRIDSLSHAAPGYPPPLHVLYCVYRI